MKVLLKIAAGFLFSVTASVQSANAQFRIGPEAGVNLGMQNDTRKSNASSESRNSTLKAGAVVGVNADIGILQKLYIQTGVFYVYDNIKFKNEVDSVLNVGNPKEEIKDDIHTFRVPLYIMYKSGFDGFGRFIAGVGPYIGYTFIANTSVSRPVPVSDSSGAVVSFYRNKVNHELALGNDASRDDLKNWDYGLNACIGYESNVGMFFRGYFRHGLQNMIPGGSSDHTLKNWGMGFTIGFNIGKDNW